MILRSALLLLVISLQEEESKPGRSVYGKGGEWDDAFAARQLEKFKGLKPDPEVLAKIAAMGDNSWLTVTPQGNEAPEFGRSEVPMVYMPDFKAFVFIGGCTDPGYSSDTWFYSPAANQWVQMWPNWIKGAAAKELNRGPYPTNRPAGRCSLGLAYDTDHKVLVNHGGANAGTNALKTFVLDPATNRWSMTVEDKDPNPMRQGDNCMGFAPGFGPVEVVPEGKVRAEGPCRMYESSTTWVYRTAQKKWEKVAVKKAAPGAHNAKLVWNSREKKLVYFTGAELWLFDPAALTWETVVSEPKGPPRYRQGNAYDPFNNVFITYGGKDENSLWVFDFAARSWREITSPEMPEKAGQKMLMDFDTDLNVLTMRAGKQIRFYRYKRASPAR